MLLGVAAVEPIQQGQISQAGKAAHTELFAAGNGARDHSGLPVLQRDGAVVLTTVNDGHSVYRLGAERSQLKGWGQADVCIAMDLGLGFDGESDVFIVHYRHS